MAKGAFRIYESVRNATPRRTPSGSWSAEQKALMHRQATQQLVALESMHRVAVPGVARQIAAPVKLKRFGLLLATAERQELAGVGRFDRSARREARARARGVAEGWARDLLVLAEQDRAGRQAGLDAAWGQLAGNDPAVVRAALSAAFAQAQAPVSSFGVVGDGVVLRVIGPSEQELPARKPKVTAHGKATVAEMPKGERASWLATITAARVLIAAKQVFATAPGVQMVRAVVVSPIEGNQPVLAARIRRARFDMTSFGADAFSVLQAAADELLFDTRGRSRELGPIHVPHEYIARTSG